MAKESMNENMITTDYHYWRKEKSREVIEHLALALTCRQTPKSREHIGIAIRNAAKLFALELNGADGEPELLAALTDEITDSVMRSPQNAKELIDAAVAKLRPDEKL